MMGLSEQKGMGTQTTPHLQMANGQHQNGSSMLIDNDEHFFSPIVSQDPPPQTTSSFINNNGKKYQLQQEGIAASMQINDNIWTTGLHDHRERRLRRRYYMKLIALIILLVLFVSLIVVSAIMYSRTTVRHKGTSRKPSATLKGAKILPTNKPSLSATGTKFSSKVTAIPTKTDTGRGYPGSTKNTQIDISEAPSVPMASETSEMNTQTMQNLDTDAEDARHFTTSTEATPTSRTIEHPLTVETSPNMLSPDIAESLETDPVTNAPSFLNYLTPTAVDFVTEIATETDLITNPSTIVDEMNTQTTQRGILNTEADVTGHFMTSAETTASATTVEPTATTERSRCREISVDACRRALHPQRGTTSSVLQVMYDNFDTIANLSTCHVDANRVVCSLYARSCETFTYPPCRSTCLEVARSCFSSDIATVNFWTTALCNKLPESVDEEICFPVSSGYEPSEKYPNACNSSYCLNNGSCFDMNGTPHCRCPLGQFAGMRCEIPFLMPPVNEDGLDESESCQPVSEEECEQVLPYNQTLEIVSRGSPQKPPWEIVAPVAACSETAKLMFCAEIHPESGCRPQDRPPYIVCRELCLEVQEQCEFFFAALGVPIDCDDYPDASPDFMCI